VHAQNAQTHIVDFQGLRETAFWGQKGIGTMSNMTRPRLQAVPLSTVWPPQGGKCYLTMSPGQWDNVLAVGYDMGFILIEVDDDERPVAAYQHPAARRAA